MSLGNQRRKEILREVESCVCRDRMTSYGDAEDNFANIAALWNVILQEFLKKPLTELEVANCCVQIKEARKIGGGRELLDNYIDGAGYNVCGGGIVQKRYHKLTYPQPAENKHEEPVIITQKPAWPNSLASEETIINQISRFDGDPDATI